MTISNKEHQWTILTCIGLKKLEIKFFEEKEFDESRRFIFVFGQSFDLAIIFKIFIEDVNGKILKSIVNKEDKNKLVHLQKDESGNVKMKIIREVIEGKLVQVSFFCIALFNVQFLSYVYLQTFSFGNNNIKKTFTRIA